MDIPNFEIDARPTWPYVATPTRWRDLHDIWAFEDDVFGADNITFERFRDWWWRYSRMAFHVRDEGGHVVGTFDASPLEPRAFQDLLEGTRDERDLSVECIRPVRRGEVVRHWCVTSLTAHSAGARRIDVLAALMAGIVERLHALPEVGYPSAWCAVAQSREGERVLQRAGFRQYGDGSRTTQPTYLLRLDSAEHLRTFRTTFAQAANVLTYRQATVRQAPAQPRRNRSETATFVVCRSRTADQPGGVAGCSWEQYLGSPLRRWSEVRPIW